MGAPRFFRGRSTQTLHDSINKGPRKFPAVEIRCKFIGNFRSNQRSAVNPLLCLRHKKISPIFSIIRKAD